MKKKNRRGKCESRKKREVLESTGSKGVGKEGEAKLKKVRGEGRYRKVGGMEMWEGKESLKQGKSERERTILGMEGKNGNS